MRTNLVVADKERTEKTICLAVTPAMKELGVPGRCRVFEIPKSIPYIMAPPRMQLYIDYSAEVYSIYLKYIAKEDIHVYSIDEVFMDVTDYLSMYQMGARELGTMIMQDILESVGITAACGIGTNLYLAKTALDITAKHAQNHIGVLTEKLYKEMLWDHQPLTDFWRIGTGTAKKLNSLGIRTMGDIAKADETMLYRLFGIDAELLIDHAWGREPVLMSDIKAYKPKSNSIGSGQVLGNDVNYKNGELIVKEMADLLSLELVEKGLVTDSITLHIGYSRRYGKKPAHGTIKMTAATNSSRQIVEYTLKLYHQIIDYGVFIHRFCLTLNHVVDEMYQQYDLFSDSAVLEHEYKMQKTILDIKDKFGKNAVLRGMNLLKGATAAERNRTIGGHKSGV